MPSLVGLCLAAARAARLQRVPAAVAFNFPRRNVISLTPREAKPDPRPSQERQPLDVSYFGLIFSIFGAAIALYVGIKSDYRDLKNDYQNLKTDINGKLDRIDDKVSKLNADFSGLSSQVTRLDKDMDIALTQGRKQ